METLELGQMVEFQRPRKVCLNLVEPRTRCLSQDRTVQCFIRHL